MANSQYSILLDNGPRDETFINPGWFGLALHRLEFIKVISSQRGRLFESLPESQLPADDAILIANAHQRNLVAQNPFHLNDPSL